MLIIEKRNAMRLVMLLTLSPIVVACGSLSNHSPTWPANLNVIQLSDGGICLDNDSAVRLAELKADLESI